MVLSDGCAASLMWFGTRAIVMLRGRLTGQSATQVHTYLQHFLRGRPKVVVLDLHAVHDCDPAGVALLAEYATRAERDGWTLRLRAPSAHIRHALDHTGAERRERLAQVPWYS